MRAKLLMKLIKILLLLLVTGILVFLFPGQVSAAGFENDSRPLCPPDLFFDPSQDCIPFGPTAYLLDMAEKGITFPETPLPIQKPDPALIELDTKYAYVTSGRAPIYQTLNDAIETNKEKIIRWITPGFNYVSISHTEYSRGKYFHNTDVGWMVSDDLVITTVPVFQGVEFIESPDHPFGWVLSMFSPGGKAETKRTPGYENDDYTGRYLEHQQLVQIYDEVTIEGWDWYLIGPDEWVIQTAVAKVSPRSGPPEGMTWTRWIEVNLYEQTMVVYDNRELVFATIIASGVHPYYTYPGIFKIEEKLDITRMRYLTDPSDAYNLESVPWTMYFDDSRAFHGAYWRANLGYPQSHGCVNLSVGDSHWLYNWAHLGDRVFVYDPTGKTPLSESDR
ncbi:MAG: L,D-transpeptidase [Chloroflexi bacterium]|nr:L,D-transpeptidase [Chloroflexota bacterium]